MHIEVQRLTRMALLLAIVIVLGLIPAIPIGIIPVPLTVQNIGILLIGLLLSPFEAFLTTGVFLLLALMTTHFDWTSGWGGRFYRTYWRISPRILDWGRFISLVVEEASP